MTLTTNAAKNSHRLWCRGLSISPMTKPKFSVAAEMMKKGEDVPRHGPALPEGRAGP
jgi:hypothetical protein